MMPFVKGITLNTECRGLLSLNADMFSSLINSGKITDYYHVEQTPFARGKFAAVRKCTHKLTGVEYAAKFIRKRRRSMDQRNDIYHEVAVLKLAEDCDYIVNIHEVYETPTEIALILQLVPGGELQRVIDVYDGLEEQQTIHVLQQILEGLNFLHSHNIAHLDLKPQNLLITSSFPHCDIKLCDFGISRVIESGIELREILGTPDYVAPEVLNYEPISLATDVWSIGVLTYVLLSGYSPFTGDTKQETFCNIAQCSLSFPEELFHDISDYAKDFIMATLVQDVNQRLTVEECLRHPWLNNSPLCKTLSSPLTENEDDDIVSKSKSKSIAVVNGRSDNFVCSTIADRFALAGQQQRNREVHSAINKNKINNNNNNNNIINGNCSSTRSNVDENDDIEEKVDNMKARINGKVDISDRYCRDSCSCRDRQETADFCCSSRLVSAAVNVSNGVNNKTSNGVARSTVEVLRDRSITC